MLDFNIVTFHSEYNYGAALQAYGLQSFIEDMGYSVGVYDYRPPRGADRMKVRILKKLQGIKPEDMNRKREKYRQFLSDKLHLNDESDSRIYVAGSDQVWNPTGRMDPHYFLQFAGEDSAKISYAASIGVRHVPEDRAELFGRYIQDFTAVSVREETAREAITPLYQGDIEVNVDPVLLHGADFWAKNAKPVEGVPEKYILVYLMHFPKNINKVISFLKKQTHLPVVCVDGQGGVQGRLSVLVKHDMALHDVGPEQFVWLIAHAEAVVTTSFHAVAFSLLFQKELYPIVGNSLSSRITDLLRRVDFGTLGEEQTSFSRETAKFDSEKVTDFLAGEQERSRRYLMTAYAACTAKESAHGLRVDLLAENCTGCSACASACPTNAIQMKLNEEGFYIPVIDEQLCTSCNRCGSVCPQTKKDVHNKEIRRAWYGWSEDSDITLSSTSGGAVPAIMNQLTRGGGVTFSAVYSDDFQVVLFRDSDHVPMESFRKSKYVVSSMEDTCRKVKAELDAGRRVMFCGAPCQVAGLVSFLGKPYENLLTCDFICGGMPSATFWQEHLLSLEKKYNSKVVKSDFRDQPKGWGEDRLTIEFANGKIYSVPSWRDADVTAFNRKVSVREVCLRCPYHSRHVADVTVADFWAYRYLNVPKHEAGMSLIVANSQRGNQFIDSLENFHKAELPRQYSDNVYSELCMSAAQFVVRKQFFKCAGDGGFERAAHKYCPTSYIHHTREWVKTHFGI